MLTITAIILYNDFNIQYITIAVHACMDAYTFSHAEDACNELNH